jgi:hypothetical protein
MMGSAIYPALRPPTGVTSRIISTKHCGMQQPTNEPISQMARVLAALAVNVRHPPLLGREVKARIGLQENLMSGLQEHLHLARRE